MNWDYHNEALKFLLGFLKLLGISVGGLLAFGLIIALTQWIVEAAPWQVWLVFWPVATVAGVYWVGYQIAKEQAEKDPEESGW